MIEMIDYIVAIIIGVVSSIVASIMVISYLSRLTPKIVISPKISRWEDIDGTGIYQIKVINEGREPIMNIKAQLSLVVPREAPDGKTIATKEIALYNSKVMELSKFDIFDMALSKNPVIYHRGERRVRRVLRLFQSLFRLSGAFAFSVCSAVKFKVLAISLENSTVPFDMKDEEHNYAFRFGTYEDIEDKILSAKSNCGTASNEQPFFRFKIYGTDSFSGFGKVFVQDYRESDSIVEGAFEVGKSLNIQQKIKNMPAHHLADV